MFKTSRLIFVVLSSVGLISCMSYNPNGYMNYQTYTYDGRPFYPEPYGNQYPYYEQGHDDSQTKKQVVVPETYHVGPYHSPEPHKNRDRRWVQSQNPQSYTIKLAEGEKASSVARTLYKAPKQNRSAQIKFHRGGKEYYEGLYGSYPSYEAAQEALNTLPENLKQGANIKSWGSVQHQVYE